MLHLSYQGGSFFKAVEVIVIQIIIVITERFGKKKNCLVEIVSLNLVSIRLLRHLYKT